MVRDGFLYAFGLLLLGTLAWYLGGPVWAIPELLLAGFVLYFFRDPNRFPPPGAWVVSPADGRVVEVRETSLDGQRVWKISVFLSIFDVHVNRSPFAGVIRSVRYTPGQFLAAYHSEASVVNEQNTVAVEGDAGGELFTVTFKQIAGLVARRIVFRKKVGDRVELGERVGMIKFGSRVDLFLPLDLVPKVQVGEHVHAGTSVMAALRKTSADAKRRPAGTEHETAGLRSEMGVGR
jgi:phosphatidylserine decarboxylase